VAAGLGDRAAHRARNGDTDSRWTGCIKLYISDRDALNVYVLQFESESLEL